MDMSFSRVLGDSGSCVLGSGGNFHNFHALYTLDVLEGT